MCREQRAEHRRADRAADRPEHRRVRGGDADFSYRDGVLRDQCHHLRAQPEPGQRGERDTRGDRQQDRVADEAAEQQQGGDGSGQ
jgi:hypothetical protein